MKRSSNIKEIIKGKKSLLLILIISTNIIIFFVYYNFFHKNTTYNISDKHLIVYGSLREEEGKYLLESFKKHFGCTYEYIKLPTEEAVRRLLDKKENHNGDIFIGGTCDGYELLKDNKILGKYKSNNANNIPNKYKDSNGYWTGFQITPLAIGINKTLWEKNFKIYGHQLPKNFNDLLDPIFKDKIILPNPETSGTGYTLMASLYQQLGPSKFKEFVNNLNENIATTTISGFNSIQRVSSGEYLITINFLGDQIIENKSSNNIISIIPENTGWNVDSIALMKNSQNQDVAKAFIDFILSDEVHSNMSKFSKAVPTQTFDKNQFKIYEKYNFSTAAKDRDKIMDILLHIKDTSN